MSLHTLEMLSAFILFGVALIAAYIPFKRRLTEHRGIEFPFGEALACGVFLGAGLIHMLHNANAQFTSQHIQYPIAFVLAGFMFLFLLFFEHVAKEMKHHKDHSNNNFVILAFLMLSLHSLLAGEAVGFSHEFSTTILLLIAIVAHKWAAAFALSVEFAKSNFKLKHSIPLFLIFALMTPLGIISGEKISHSLGFHPAIEPTLISLAAGTFLYIGTLHGLEKATMIKRCCNLSQFSFMIIGFAIMAAAAVYT